jgi:hypothetical protein
MANPHVKTDTRGCLTIKVPRGYLSKGGSAKEFRIGYSEPRRFGVRVRRVELRKKDAQETLDVFLKNDVTPLVHGAFQ